MNHEATAAPIEPIACSLYTTQKLTGLGRTKVYGLIDDGTLETVKIGTRRLVLMKSIRALMQN